MDEKTGGLELEESLDDFMTMYAAGNATTSTTLLWSIGQLTRNPAVMEKLVEEVLFSISRKDSTLILPISILPLK